MSKTASSPPDRPRNVARRRGLEILALTSLAIAQPLFAVLAEGADFFVAHDSRPVELVLFTLFVYLGPPILLWLAVESAARLGDRRAGGRVAHILVLAALSALLVAPWLDRIGAAAGVGIGTALVTGTALALAVDRSYVLRSFLSLVAPLTLAVPLLFLLLPPMSNLVRPQPIAAVRAEVGDPKPVVLVIFDELPVVSLLDAERRIDRQLFPNFAALAESSHWFTDATSVSPATNQAVPAILTGRYPAGERTATAVEHPRSLFTLLGERYEHRVVETQTRLCPEPLCPSGHRGPLRQQLIRLLADASVVYSHVVAPTALRSRLPPISATWTDFLGLDRDPDRARERAGDPDAVADRLDLHIFASDRVQVFEEFLARLAPDDDGRPGLYFLHVMLPHVPWVYLPSGKEYWGSLHSSALAQGVGRDTLWTTEAWLVAQGYQRHLLQLRFVDTLLGRLLERLEAVGLDDEAVLVVTADHGLSFRPGLPGREPTPETFADIMAVPLFVRTPGQTEGVVDRRNVELVDVLPTVAELLEMELPHAVDGRSMLTDGPRRPFKVLIDDENRRTYPPEALEARFASLERKLEIFDRGLFGIGPRPQLLDVPVSELPVGEPAALQVRLDQAEQYRQVDLDGDFLPAQIFGRARSLVGDETLDVELALAVNGVVRAVTRTFDENGIRFAAMVPEESFVEGANRVDVYVVEIAEGVPRLRPTERHEAPVYSLAHDATGRVVRLEASDGTTCRLDPQAVDGGYYRHGTGFVGWARDAAGERPYVVVMAFADGRLVHTVTTGVEPPSEAPVAGRPAYARAGFRFVLPAAVLDAARELRLFAVLGERGAELPALPGSGRCLDCDAGR
ncbi:MAG: sulfatase-like hydrolase/transferase [Thermoanaerobaculia bacterium]|nr:sulfatase-like hydrolase/transferase [Thermoanaerobaculia bacterium]